MLNEGTKKSTSKPKTQTGTGWAVSSQQERRALPSLQATLCFTSLPVIKAPTDVAGAAASWATPTGSCPDLWGSDLHGWVQGKSKPPSNTHTYKKPRAPSLTTLFPTPARK